MTDRRAGALVGASIHHARVVALAVVLVGISVLILSPSVRALQPVSELPLDELRSSVLTRVPDDPRDDPSWTYTFFEREISR